MGVHFPSKAYITIPVATQKNVAPPNVFKIMSAAFVFICRSPVLECAVLAFEIKKRKLFSEFKKTFLLYV